MANTLKLLRVLSDPTRIRILTLLKQEELSVNEIQRITGMGQSRISTHLGMLNETGAVNSRRDGKKTYYSTNQELGADEKRFLAFVDQCASELSEYEADQLNLKRILSERDAQSQKYFSQLAGRFDRIYGPGRSWEAFGQMLLRMIPPVIVADLGCGEGLISEMLAQNCKKVIAVDNSPKMVEFGQKKAEKHEILNLEFRLGNLEDPPIESDSIDITLLSQALHHAEDPRLALKSAYRITKPGGKILILDLLKHTFQDAKKQFGDTWLGFTESKLHYWLETSGFIEVDVTRVAKESHPPYFETILASGSKPASREFKSAGTSSPIS